MNPAAYLEMAEIEDRHWWFRARRQIVASVISDLRLPSTVKILEVGCGTGGNLRMLSRFGDVSALEMDDAARAIAQSKAGSLIEIRAGHCPENIPYEPASFDVICMLDVLEHVERDAETLVAIGKLLKPGGTVVLTVPAYQWMFGPHDEFLHHKRRYASSGLRKLVVSAGLTVRRLTYFNTVLFPIAAIVRLKSRLMPAQVRQNETTPPKVLNWILQSVFSSERHFISRMNFPFGLSLLCTVQSNSLS